MEIKTLSTDKIKVGVRYRADLGDLTELKDSISERGILQPLVVDKYNKLLAGERRLRCAIDLELEEVPVVVVPAPHEVDKLEIELIENICRKDMTWSERSMLEKQIFDLKKEKDPDWSMNKQASYLDTSKGAVARRLQLAEAMEAIPELADQQNESQAWKAWHRIKEDVVVEAMKRRNTSEYTEASQYADKHYKIGDAIAGMKKSSPGIVGFAEVDPPYAIEIDRRKSRTKDQENASHYNEIDSKEYKKFLEATAEEVYRLLIEPSFCVWWFGPTWYKEVKDVLTKVGFKVNDVPAIWYKGQSGQTASPDTALASSYEPFFLCRKGNPKMANPGRSNVFVFDPVPSQRKIHITERPLALMETLLDTFTYPGMKVLCPFLGSGVTLRACYKKGLVGWGFDLDEALKRRFIGNVVKDQDRADGVDKESEE